MRQLFIPPEALKTHCQHFEVINDILRYLSANEGKGYAERVRLYPSTDNEAEYFPLSTEVCARFYKLLILYRNNCFLSISAEKIPQLIEDVKYRVFNGLNEHDVKSIKDILRIIFNYNDFSHGKKLNFEDFNDGKAIVHSENREKSGESWCAGLFLKNLGVRYCVYCNAETLYAVNYKAWQNHDEELKNFLINHSAFDHFYNYDEYPYLGLTLSNLVPACTRCNSGIKGKKDFSEMLNPYVDDFHSIDCFVYCPDTVRQLYSCPDASMLRLLHRNESEKRKNNLAELYKNNFHLMDVYRDIYKLEIEDIITRRDSLRSALLQMHGKRFSIPLETLKQITGLYVSKDDINKYRFGKLLIDLCSDLP